MRRIIIVFIALMCISSCSKNKYSLSNEIDDEYGLTERYKLYEVLSTDTIISVAKKTGVSAEIIIKYNSLKKPYLLKPGEMLKIPNIQTQEEDLIDEVDSLEDIDRSSSRHIQIAPRR